MSKHIVHVNRQFIAMNAKDQGNRPVFTVKTKGHKGPRYARGITGNGNFSFIESSKPLSCGARVWLETDADLQLVDEMSFSEAKET